MFFSRLTRALGYGGSDEKSPDAIRIGILGCAKIAPMALINPAYHVSQVKVTAIAARDKEKATSFAKKHHIPRVLDSYEELVADPEIDAIYIPSPNGLHFKWAMKALQSGKHVLCEKPLTSNAKEAELLLEQSRTSKKVLMEASHSFYHPALIRAREIIRSGEIGELKEITANFEIPKFFISSSDIRFNVNGTQPLLAGGAFMDAGVYAVNCVRFLSDLRFESCVSAVGKERFPGVDESLEGTVKFENSNVVGKVKGSMIGPLLSLPTCTCVGSKGTLEIANFLAPSIYHYIQVSDGKISRTEKEYGEKGGSSYEYQLRAFANCVKTQTDGGPAKVGGSLDDPLNTMQFIDSVYLAAGFKVREGYPI